MKKRLVSLLLALVLVLGLMPTALAATKVALSEMFPAELVTVTTSKDDSSASPAQFRWYCEKYSSSYSAKSGNYYSPKLENYKDTIPNSESWLYLEFLKDVTFTARFSIPKSYGDAKLTLTRIPAGSTEGTTLYELEAKSTGAATYTLDAQEFDAGDTLSIRFYRYSDDDANTQCNISSTNLSIVERAAKGCAVTFDYNYVGAPEAAKVEVESGKAIGDKLPADPTRENYRFNGWALSTNLSKKLTAETVIDGDCTYKALWLHNDYKIVFNKNADDATGEMDDQWGTFDTALTLNKCTFRYEGYDFAGWKLENDTIADGGTIRNYSDYDDLEDETTSTYGETVNLYAIWEKAKSDAEKEIDEKLNAAAKLISKNYTPKFGTDTNLLTMASARLSDSQKADITVALKEAASKKDMFNDAAASVDKDGALHYKWNNTPGGYTSATTVNVSATFVLTYKGVSKEVPGVTVIMGLDETKALKALKAQAERISVPTSIDTDTDLKTLPHYLQNTNGSDYGLWAEINWQSSNAGAIKIGNTENSSDHTFPVTVTQAKGDADVKLTATLTYSGTDGKITCSKEFPVKVLGSEKAVDYQVLLDKVFGADNALTDPATGNPINKGAVTTDIQFPTTRDLERVSLADYGVGFDGAVTPVILTSSNEDVIVSADVANVARLMVYRPLPTANDAEVTVTVGIYNRVKDATPADYLKQTPLATKAITLTVKKLEQSELDEAAAFMAKVCTPEVYWNGIKKANRDKDHVTGDLQWFFEIVPDGDGYKFIRTEKEFKRVGVKADSFDGWEAHEKYRTFRSSVDAVIAHEKLSVTQPEYNTPVKIDSVLTHAVYGKYYEKYKDDPVNKWTFSRFYKQPVETVVTVIGKEGIVDPNVQDITVTVKVEGHAFDENFTDLTDTYTCRSNEYKYASEALLDVLGKANYTYTGAPSYITSVTDSKKHTLTAGDAAHGPCSGWMFTVNGEKPMLDATTEKRLDQYLVQKDDIIRFYYVECMTADGHHTPGDNEVTVVKPTHETAGSRSYTCAVKWCGKQVTETIPATGHTWGETSYIWADNYASCTAVRECKENDGGVETETAIATYAVVTPATATAAGLGRYTATFENEAFQTQTHDVTIPATGGSTSGGSTGGTSRPSGSKKDTTAETPKTRFDDVRSSSWYQEAVDYVAENGIMGGVSANTFAPNAPATRAMLVTVLHRLAGTPDAEKTHSFTDLANGAWYAGAVAWAAENGIVDGVGDALFAPNAHITREQLAAILYRYAIHCGLDVTAAADLNAYTDGAQISTWAQDAMRWAIASGLISGRSASALAPQSGATRAEIAQLLMNFAKLLKK